MPDLSILESILVGAAIVVSAACALTSLLSTLPFQHWIFRSWEFPRLQICALALLCIPFLLSFEVEYFDTLQYLFVYTNIAVILFQSHWILPYTPFYKAELKRADKCASASKLSVLTSNVLMTNRNAQALIDLVYEQRPDILVTLESDLWWQQKLDDALEEYSHRVAVPHDNLYGMHVYSRLPLSLVEVRYTVKSDIPSITCNAELDDGRLVNCFFVHPEPPSPTEAQTATPRDKELLLYAKQAELCSRPVIVTGDLNDVAWSPTTVEFREKSGLLDPRIGRGFYNTFHTKHWWARWPLDHIFVSDHFSLIKIKSLKDIGSDHYPLYTELNLNETNS